MFANLVVSHIPDSPRVVLNIIQGEKSWKPIYHNATFEQNITN